MIGAYPPQTLFFFILIGVLFFISRTTIQEVFYFFSNFTHNRKIIFLLTSILFFPGTVLHEMAHFVMAIALMLKVREVTVFPEFDGDSIKLGRVLYEKKDFFRGIIVGIAPIVAGIFFLWFLSQWAVRVQGSPLLTTLFIYAIFVVSTTMFSSKQDLIDIIFIIPLLIIAGVVLYVFSIPIIDIIANILPILDSNLVVINTYLLYSLVIHIVLIVVFKSFRKALRR